MSIRKNAWLNSDGLAVGFGTRKVDSNASAVVATEGAIGEVSFEIKETDLVLDPTTSDALYHNIGKFPSGTSFRVGEVLVSVAFDTVTSIAIGSFEWVAGGDNTPASVVVIDEDSILTDAAGAVGNLTLGASIPTLAEVASEAVPGTGNEVFLAAHSVGAGVGGAGVAKVIIQYVLP